MSDLDEIWDAVHIMKRTSMTHTDSINTLNDRTMNTDVALRNSKGDIIERITEMNREMMTYRERIEAIAAEVQRMKDRQFPQTSFSDLTTDELLDTLDHYSAAMIDGTTSWPAEYYRQLFPDLRAEVRRRLNNQ